MPSSNSVSFTPVPTRKASEAIYEQISEMIMSGQLAPGDRLPSERSMMEMFQRSRPTIREALRMLEHSSLIKTIPGSNGAIVTKPSTSSVEQSLENMISMNRITHQNLLEVREQVERAAVRWAAERRNDEDLAKMSEILGKSAENAMDFDEFAKNDIAFHNAIAEASHNRLISIIGRVCHRMILDILKNSYNHKNVAEKKEMVKNVTESHNMIYEAIKAKNVQAAETAIKNHIENFSADIL